MKHLRLGHKIFLTIALVVLGLITFSYLSLSYLISQDTETRTREDLNATRSIIVALHESRLERIKVVCGSVAEAPRFKAAIDEQDGSTVQDQAASERAIVHADLILATGRSKTALGWVGPCKTAPDVTELPFLMEAQAGKFASGLWLLEGRLYQIAAQPARFLRQGESGEATAGSDVAGALVMGEEVNQAQAQEIRRMTRTDVMYLLPGGVPGPSTLDGAIKTETAARLQSFLSALPADEQAKDQLVEIALGGQRHLVLAEPLRGHGPPAGDAKGIIGRLLLVRNLDAALSHLRQIQKMILGGGAFAVLISLVLSLLLVHAITVPVAGLVKGVQEVGRGNYDFEIKAVTFDEIGILAQRFDEMRVNLKDYISRVKEGERVKRDLELARKIQASLLPTGAPSLPGIDLAGSCSPANAVGGDYYDFITLPNDRLALIVADVSGHNVGAALMMAMSRSVLRTATYAGHNPGRILDETNRILFDDLVNASLFFSAFHAIYTASTRELRYANAGHNPPFVVRADDPGKRDLTTEGMLVGLMPDWTPDEAAQTLTPGDVFVMYTDGIIEATNAQDELYGDKRLVELVRQNCARPAKEIIQIVLDDVARYGNHEPLKDDATLMIMRVI